MGNGWKIDRKRRRISALFRTGKLPEWVADAEKKEAAPATDRSCFKARE